MKRIIYTITFIASVIAMCVGLITIKGIPASEAALPCGVIALLSIALYKDYFNEFEK